MKEKLQPKRRVIGFGAGPHARELLVPTLLATGRCELIAWVDPSESAGCLAKEKFPAARLAATMD